MAAPGSSHPFTLLKAFPWYNKQILELESIAMVGQAGLLDVEGLGLQGLVEKLEGIEKVVCDSQSTHPLRSKLLASSSSMIEERLQNITTLAPEKLSSLASNLLEYRLMDVAIALQSGVSPGGQSGRLPIPLPPKMYFKLTSHWPSLVTRGLWLLRECGDDPAPDLAALTGPTQSIFTSLVQRKDTIESHKIMGNFECVAAYLSLIMKGVSDLPSTMPEFQELVMNLCHDSHLHQDRWESFFSSIKSVHAFKLPLLLALASSVACLFLPSSLMNKDLNRHLLLQMWQGLGGPRPERLVRLEFILWQALFDVALGRYPLSSRFRAAFREIETLDLSGVECPDSEWLSGDPSFQESIQKLLHRRPPHKKPQPNSPRVPQATPALADAEAASARPTTRSVTAQQNAKVREERPAPLPVYPPAAPTPRRKSSRKSRPVGKKSSSSISSSDEEPVIRKRRISVGPETGETRPQPSKALKLEDGTSVRRVYETIDLTVETRGPPVIDLTIDEAEHPERFNAEPVMLCQQTGVIHVAKFHFAHEAEWFSALWRALEDNGPTNTFFAIVSAPKIEQMSVLEAQKYLKMRTMIIPGASKQTSLDGASLRVFAMLDKPVRMQVFLESDYLSNPADFPHVPDISQQDGVIDLLSLCNVLELSNATLYTLSDFDRHRTVEARRLARRIVAWLEARFIFNSQHGMRLEVYQDIWMLFLARQVKALVGYGDLVEQRDPLSNPGVFRTKVDACARGHPDLQAKLEGLEGWKADSFDWCDDLAFKVSIRQSPGTVSALCNYLAFQEGIIELIMADNISTLPTELIQAIVNEVVATDPLELHSSNRGQAIDLVNITHLNSRLRQVVINDPILWAQVAFLNGINLQFLQAILLRSLPYTIHLAFTEDNTLPEGQILQSVMGQLFRVACLQVEVAEGYDGTFVKSLLAAPVPNLRNCVVRFRGSRHVCLNPEPVDLFSNHAPHLETLDLLNCYLLPTTHRFQRLSSVSNRYFGDETVNAGHLLSFTSVQDLIEWKGQLSGLTALTLFNCITPVDAVDNSGLPALDLPLLCTLTIAAAPTVCEQLAKVLRFPPQCDCKVTILFSRQRISRQDVANAAASACAFVPLHQSFMQCRLTTLEDRHSLQLVNTHGGIFVLEFKFHLLELMVPKSIHFCIWALNLTLRCFNGGSFSVDGLMAYSLWDSLSSNLSDRLEGVSELSLALHWLKPPMNVALSRFFLAMPCVQSVNFHVPKIWGDSDFLRIAFRSKIFPSLQTISLELHEVLSVDARLGLADFLQYRQHRCRVTIGSVQFVISPGLVRDMGFASLEGVKLMVGEIACQFPDDVYLDWVEGTTI
ncbi:hypothetical protein EST38_g7394 [Candolleomyces aberdarensis]|uniref:F-box domain-containing protein n=1 Tax=Candolleomyces aberdarensis TaxID=2316362 RepID=A0A4Q2DH36_9AGAR|nr:hypothetical protein EST38_g7394 [Candolleomyces aberdarensis]